MRYLLRILLLVFLFFSLVACDASGSDKLNDPRAWSLSISHDGSYVVSAHADRRIVLWNLRSKTKKIISTNGNIYSAYFVKGRNLFLWQDLDDIVHLTRPDGTDKDSWKHFPTYGHIISSDLQHYFSSDKHWNVYHGHGKTMRPVKKDGDNPSFSGSGKLLNMELSSNGKWLLTSGAEYDWDNRDSRPKYPSVVANQRSSEYAGTVIWSVSLLRPLAVLYGHAVKTYATFSPDGKYVVSGDEGGRGIVWNTEKKKRIFELGSLFWGKYIGQGKNLEGLVGKDLEKTAWDKSGLIQWPEDYSGESILAIKFIDLDNHYLRITANQHYAILYAIDNPLPLKYLDLGTDPYPATREYARNTAIDSAPAAGILVTGQANGPGINVYRYDKAARTLKRIWVAR